MSANGEVQEDDKQEKLRAEVINEIVNSEKNYVNDLEVLVNVRQISNSSNH